MDLLIIIFGLTLLEATHEGYALKGRRLGISIFGTIAGVIEFIKHVGIVIMVVYLLHCFTYAYHFQSFKWIFLFTGQLALGWAALRYSVFDFAHNLAAGIPLFYIGNMKLYDKFLQWLLKRQIKSRFFIITRIVLLAAGLSLILRL